MSWYFGFDTSNYTTSVAAFNPEKNIVVQRKKLLPVKAGERGIRQSDAVFHHTQQIKELFNELTSELKDEHGFNSSEVASIGVSVSPRRVEGSYMPCFTVGTTTASVISDMLSVPCHLFSHQEGHICAALYSSQRLDLLNEEFLAFHVSGGTTESLVCKPSNDNIVNVSLIGTSSDLKAGQAIDRVGVRLGLNFPCGPELEKLALKSERTFKIKPSMKDLDCSMSGVENKCNKMISDGEKPEDIAKYCLSFVEASIASMAEAALLEYPNHFIVFSGGVMSNQIIRKSLEEKFDCAFAEPIYSSDNAVGIAVLASMKKV